MAATGGRRRATVVVAVLGLGIAGSIAGAYHYRQPIAEYLASQALARAGVGTVTFRMEAVEIDHAVIADLEVPAFGATARRVRVEFAVSELLDRHVQGVRIEALAVKVNAEHGFAVPPATGGPGGEPGWTIGTLVLEGARLAVETAQATADLSLDANLRHLDGSRYQGQADFDGQVMLAGTDAVPVTGRVTFRGTPEVPETITVDAVVTAPPLPVVDASDARITGTLKDNKLALRADITIADGRLDLSFEGPLPAKPDIAEVAGVITLNAESPPLPLLRVRTAEAKATLGSEFVTLTGTLSAEEGTVTFDAQAERPSDLSAWPKSLRVDAGFDLAGIDVPQVPGPVDVAGRARIDVDGTAAAMRVTEQLRAAFEVDGEPFSATVAAAETPVIRSANVFDLQAPLDVNVGQATLDAFGETLSITDVDAEVRPRPAPGMTVRAARLDANRPGLAPPVDVEGSVSLDGESIRFDGHVRALDGIVAATVNGQHDLGPSNGTAEVSLGRIDFIPGLLQPGDLSGVFPSIVTDVRGGIESKGAVSWGPDGLASDLVVHIHALGFAAGGAIVEGVSGSVAIDRPWPPRTPPGQTLEIERIVAGVPMTNGTVRFHRDDAGHLNVVDAKFHVLGGAVDLADFVLGADAGRQTATIRIRDVGVQDLIDLAELEGTSGTGVLGGILPVSLSAEGISVSGGRLATFSPGILSYDPLIPPAALQGGGEGVSLMLQALKNFHYDVLSADINGEAGGEWIAALHLAGKNPDFMDGYPFELNFNLSGKLDALLIDGMAGFSLPERIGEGLSGTRP